MDISQDAFPTKYQAIEISFISFSFPLSDISPMTKKIPAGPASFLHATILLLQTPPYHILAPPLPPKKEFFKYPYPYSLSPILFYKSLKFPKFPIIKSHVRCTALFWLDALLLSPSIGFDFARARWWRKKR